MSNETATTISTLPADQALALQTIFGWRHGYGPSARIRLPHPDFPAEFKMPPRCGAVTHESWTHLIRAELSLVMGDSFHALDLLEAKKLIARSKAVHTDTGQLWKLPGGHIIDANVIVKDGKRTITVSVDGTFVAEIRGPAGGELERFELSPEAVALAEGLAADADEPKGDANGSGFLATRLSRALSVSGVTLNKYATTAGVKTPARGKRDYRYSVEDAKKIAQQIRAGGDTRMRNHAQIVLDQIAEQTKNKPKTNHK